MSENVYSSLREHLDTLPSGFPSSPGGVELRILRKLFTEDDVRLALCMGREPEPAAAIAARCGLAGKEAAAGLDSMAARGLISKRKKDGETLYQAEAFVFGIYEFQLPTIDRELAEMVEEYLPWLGMSWAPLKTGQQRIIPIASAVEASNDVMTYDRVRDVVRGRKLISITDCICSKQQALLGKSCNFPSQRCMGFDELAEAGIEYGWPGMILTVEEALAQLDRSEELGLVLRPDNSQDPRFICECCSCCCPGLRYMKMLPNPSDFIHSNYRAVHDADECVGCETCVERCPMGAISGDGDSVTIDHARCIGCGVCLSGCQQKALSLEVREPVEVPPLTVEEQHGRILSERGLA